ncbi:MAG: hypothetical protein P1U37_06745 [Minwuia sp.]|nr:hypothetical protein [Minwuia sp.]
MTATDVPSIADLAAGFEASGWSMASDLGDRPRVEWQSTENLLGDPRFQRGLGRKSHHLIRRIAQNFQWCLFGIIICTDNGDGTFMVIDGQHRAIAATLHGSVRSVPVFVTDAETLHEQARAFLDINRHRVKLNALQIHKARRTAGDPDAAAIARICDETGITIPGNVVSWSNIKPLHALCIGTLYNVRRMYGDDVLRRSLKVCAAAWPDSAGDIIAVVVGATASAINEGDTDDTDIVAILRTRTGDEWKERARAQARADGTTMAKALHSFLVQACAPKAKGRKQ